jgi:hypothetical protein
MNRNRSLSLQAETQVDEILQDVPGSAFVHK